VPKKNWLQRELIVLGVEAVDLPDLLARAAAPLARATGLDEGGIAQALVGAARESDFSVGLGVIVPHVELPGIEQTTVAFLRLARPLALRAIDGVPIDLVFVVLARPGDPVAHLRLLAHLARLLHSRVLREGVRAAESGEAIVDLVRAAEARHFPRTRVERPASQHCLAILALAGEKAVDAILVNLLDAGLGHAAIVDAQSVREAASHEVPLFTGFREVFGDPGGQRLIVVELPSSSVEMVTNMLREVCDEHRPTAAELIFVPTLSRWQWQAPATEPPERGH
jgi:PTS system nitrogen regulatory IIA component